MGAKQSKLKKEIAALQVDAAASAAKHSQEVETLRNEKRMLEFKLHALQEMTAKAQVEAETATQLAIEHEQRAKALKWELVRRLSVPTSSPSPASTLTASTSSSISSLARCKNDPSISALPRVPVSWKLKEGTTLRRSNTSIHTKRSVPDHKPAHTNKKPVASSRIETRDQTVSLAAPQLHSTPGPAPTTRKNSTKEHPASNQEDVTPLKPETAAPPVATSPAPAATPSISTTTAVDLDIFAPVKRRSSTRDSIVSTAASVAAEAKHDASSSERVDSFKGSSGSAKDSGTDSDREPSRKAKIASQQDDDAVRQSSRGVHATAKGHGPRESKSDDVLALSDDEDDD